MDFERYMVKNEIEGRAPDGLAEDGKLESGNPSNNNQQNDSSPSYSDHNTGENLKKYNILLQASELGIKDAHMVTNAFLNESSTAGILCPVQRNSPIKLPPMAEMHDIGLSNCPEPMADENDFRVMRFCSENNGISTYEDDFLNSSAGDIGVQGVDESEVLSTPYQQQRKIARAPFKVLDAPALQDDYYLNLLDWSNQNTLAVGLGSCVYLWSASNSKVTKLHDLGTQGQVSSISWSVDGNYLAVGTSTGEL